ncbi:hypothetical protein EDC96DRAFT_521552 [Choanephora cucurbitarum]|nr:hypothetical protein EDC96DRAFT_521552 [Choanephora cucurbitarum]
MNLTSEQQKFKLPIVQQGSKQFFCNNSAKNWDFLSYYDSTHNDVNKAKARKKIAVDYNNDLNWIANQDNLPDFIKEYARALIAKKKPNHAELHRSLAKRACKKQKTINNNININGPISGGTMNNFCKVQTAEKNEGCSSKGDLEEKDEESDHSKKDDAEPSVWLDWINYLESRASLFHPYSPEANNIIRSGKGISPRPHLDRDIYERHMIKKITEEGLVPKIYQIFIDQYIESDDLASGKKVIRSLSKKIALTEDEDEISEFEFLEKLLLEVHRAYSLDLKPDASEDAFNQLVVYPLVTVISESLVTEEYRTCFIQGQPILESMTRQLKLSGLANDDKSQYKTDGLIQITSLKNLEFLLVETSGCFNNKDKIKLNFDHHKGLFGALSMLKCIADDYSFASVDCFTNVKVFFLNAAGNKLYLWGLSYKKEGLFDLFLEASLSVRPNYEDKEDYLPQLVQFCLIAKSSLQKSIENILVLKQKHCEAKASCRYSVKQVVNLSDLVSPIILKLTKEKDSTGMADLGPKYSPLHD